MWNETYSSLSNFEKGEFRRLCNYLMSHTYLVRDIYRADKQWAEPSNDYRMVMRLYECMYEYFSVSGWKLEKDENYGVISLINEYDNNRARFDMFTTLFVYTCRLIYEEGRETTGSNHNVVRTETGAIVEKMRLLGLLEKDKTTIKKRLDAQRTLAHFNIIQKTEASAWNPEGNVVLILPSILSIVTNQGINDMMLEIEELRSQDLADESEGDDNIMENEIDDHGYEHEEYSQELKDEETD